ncbi:sensor domain-containing protein [Nocardia barduliensis]|uniref:sensor domain-containing protein n=1 Tax=Nocardia barduliensis TaxID=2736643 RepID=UPI0015730276|nr:sensor domain-containing protein [Nocardia barduliensis]
MIRARGLLAALAPLVVVIGCGSQEQTAAGQPELPALGPVVAAAPVTTGPETDPARLRDRLLGDADLPPGFTALPPPADTGATSASPTNPAECGKVLAPLGVQRPGALAQASTQFAGPNFSSIDIDAAGYPADAVGLAFSDVQEILRRCAHYSSADDSGITVDYRIGGLDQPPAGDASASFQVRTTSDGLTLGSSVAIVQVGSTLVQVAVTAPESVDPGVLSALTAAQVRRLRGVAGP